MVRRASRVADDSFTDSPRARQVGCDERPPDVRPAAAAAPQCDDVLDPIALVKKRAAQGEAFDALLGERAVLPEPHFVGETQPGDRVRSEQDQAAERAVEVQLDHREVVAGAAGRLVSP